MNEGDLLTDRKRLKRHLVIWRALTVLVLVGALVFIARQVEGKKVGGVGGDYIALVSVDGVMADSPDRDDMFQDIADDPHAKALIVRMDSPGGTAMGGEEMYYDLKKVAAKKPVVSVMRTLCASACYMAAMGTDYIVARDGTLTGSIGVMLQAAEFSRLADKLGITPITIKSGKYKDVPSLTDPFTPEQREVVSSIVMDAYDHFVKLIVQGRKLPEERVRQLADGRVYTGSQAYNLKLIDAIGGQDEAIDWLAKTRHINPKLEVDEVKPEPQFDSLLDKLGGYTGIKIFGKSTVGLDGLVSIWHPSLMN